MKITTITNNQPLPGVAGNVRGKDTEVDFQQLLDDRLRAVEETSKMARAQAVAAPAAATEVRLNSLELTDTALATLSAYEQALGNTTLASTDLEPFVASLEEESTGLLALKEQLPGEDPLAKIVEQVATLSLLEVAKFRRGDYDA